MWHPREPNDAQPWLGGWLGRGGEGASKSSGNGWGRAPPGLTRGRGWGLSQEALALVSVFSPFLHCLGEGHGGTLWGEGRHGGPLGPANLSFTPCPHTLGFFLHLQRTLEPQTPPGIGYL